MRWQKITLVGMGLLGGSLGLAIQRRGLAGHVAGYVRRPASVTECRAMRVADEVGLDLAAAVRGADLVVLCTPLAQMPALAEQMGPALLPGALVTDVGSVKAGVVRDLEERLAKAGAHFIGSHPMAGGEKMGVQAARADLFERAACIVTPTAHSDPEAVRRLTEFWQSVGGVPWTLPAERHDELVARSSHLPHFVAATLAHYILDPVHPPEQAGLCATGFRDTTRIASGSPEMWRDIAEANAVNLTAALDTFIGELQRLRQALGNGNATLVRQLLETAKQRRDAWCAQAASPSLE